MSESGWREAWEREKHAVGRAVHEAWAAEKIRQGFAGHAWEPGRYGRTVCDRDGCYLPKTHHHPDMLDYVELETHIQAYDIETGMVGFRMGYEAAKREAAP